MSDTHEVQLRAGDARQRDVGRGIARNDQRTIHKHNKAQATLLNHCKKNNQRHRVGPLHEDQNRDIIRIDVSPKNAGVASTNTSLSAQPKSKPR